MDPLGLTAANAARLWAVVALCYLYQKKRRHDEGVAASALLHELPRMQAIAAPTPPRSGETTVYRHHRAPMFPDPLPAVPFAGVATLYDNFQRSVRLVPGRPCLGHRAGGDGPYVWRSYLAVHNQMTDFGSGLVNKCGLDKGAFVGIMMINRPEWVVVDQACNAYSLVTVPLYDTLDTTRWSSSLTRQSCPSSSAVSPPCPRCCMPQNGAAVSNVWCVWTTTCRRSSATTPAVCLCSYSP